MDKLYILLNTSTIIFNLSDLICIVKSAHNLSQAHVYTFSSITVAFKFSHLSLTFPHSESEHPPIVHGFPAPQTQFWLSTPFPIFWSYCEEVGSISGSFIIKNAWMASLNGISEWYWWMASVSSEISHHQHVFFFEQERKKTPESSKNELRRSKEKIKETKNKKKKKK